ncbi:MAG: hypothetical protein H6719_38475, partial [Sandaracinaceae bacterium]|nr:hypothetical protein [Sandaracinaceae bacterium]
ARADLAAGRPRWLTYGYPAAARWDYADLLEERYGIELEAIAGCVIDGEISTRAAAYDSVIERWLRETYPGRDVLAETWADAETRWRERVSARQPRDEVEAAILAVLEEVDLSALLGPEEPEGEPLRADEPDGSPRRGSRARRRARRASRAARR